MKSCCLPLFHVSLLWFQMFEAIGEDKSPLCTESMMWCCSGVRAVPILPRSAGPGLCWAIFLTYPKSSCSFWTGRASSLAKQTSFSYVELRESTLEKVLNKTSFPRRLEREGEATALRPLSNPMPELAPECHHPGFWHDTDFIKEQ